MKTYYFKRKSELSQISDAFNATGYNCYRTKAECRCKDYKGASNRRQAILILEDDKVILRLVRCKACAK